MASVQFKFPSCALALQPCPSWDPLPNSVDYVYDSVPKFRNSSLNTEWRRRGCSGPSRLTFLPIPDCVISSNSCGSHFRTVSAPCSVSTSVHGRSGNDEGDEISRRVTILEILCGTGIATISWEEVALAVDSRPQFRELESSGGVKALDIREGTGTSPRNGDKVSIHYYGRLAAKQGWRFDSTYDHKDKSGDPEPYDFVIGSGTVIAGLDAAVRTMKEGGIRRVVIPPSQGYQNTSQGPIPPDYFDRQRLYTTIFNQTRIANGEGLFLGTIIFDIELLSVRAVKDFQFDSSGR